MPKTRTRLTIAARVESLEQRALLSAVTQVFTINTAQSTATGGGSLAYSSTVDANGNPNGGPTATAPLKRLYHGSFTNNAVGTITIQKSDNTIQFLNADIAGENTAGNAFTFGIPVNFAGSFSASQQSPTGTDTGVIYASISDLAAGLTSGPLTLTNGSFSNAGETLPIITGVLGVSITGTQNGVAVTPLTGFAQLSSFTTSVANTSTLPSTLTTDANGVETLTIQASGSFTDNLGGLTATLTLTGHIVATYTPPASAVVVTASVANHILTVQGTAGDDFIQIHQTGSNISVESGGASIGTFDATTLTQIDVFGNAGADNLKTGPSLTVPTILNGGAGPDTLVAANSGDSLVGGAGPDSLVALASGDLLSGGKGADSLVGSASFASGNPNDTLGGGKGADSISSLSGDDSLVGGIGNDTLLSANSTGDSINGGAGTNVTITQNSMTPSFARPTDAASPASADTVVSSDLLGDLLESQANATSLLR